MEKEIEKQMRALGISYEQAKELVEYDKKIDKGIEDEETVFSKPTKEEKQALRKTLQAKTAPTKKKAPQKRERKIDLEKQEILSTISQVLQEFSPKVKTETEINFTVGENSYTLKLTKHRNPKN